MNIRQFAQGLLIAGAIALPALASAQRANVAVNAAKTRVTPESAVLVYVDYVTGLDNLMTTIPSPQYRNNIAAFSKLNKTFQIPAVVLGEENAYYGKFLPEIRENVTFDTRQFPRTTISGYTPEFRKWLRASGRKNIVIGGISIDNCTLHTTLDLLRDGFNVYVVVDASGTNSKVAEDVALIRMRDAGAVMVTWLAMISELGQDFESKYGKDMMGIIQAHWPASTYGSVSDSTPDGAGMQLPKR